MYENNKRGKVINMIGNVIDKMKDTIHVHF